MPSDLHERLRVALADRYRIERELGAGGMATVFLAEDVKHKRKVALKVLKPELAAVLGADRFVVEITTTASMSHPHILPLFDSGTADGFLFYVMPYVEGETLRSKLDRETQLGIDEAVRIAREVLDALEYAHQHGVIHRDIKPENILMQSGRPMVADFGIALAVSAAAGGRMTETGLSLGTPHYMSPEQATAEKEITGRSDVYSLASVLYEMLTGEPPHMGNSAQQIIMKIITEPAALVTKFRKSVPPNVAAAVAKALEKLPADRFNTAKEFSEALGSPSFALGTGSAVAMRAPESRWKLLAGGAIMGGALVSIAVAAAALLGPRAKEGDGARVEFAFRTNVALSDRGVIAISPDGRRIMQSFHDSAGQIRLLTREIGSTEVSVVPGSEGWQEVSFEPNGQWLVGFVDGSVRRMPVAGGPSTELATSATNGSDVGTDGSLLFSRNGDGLWRVPPGGVAERLTSLDSARHEFQHWYPQVLPGARAAIFNNFSTPLSQSRIEAVEFATGKRTILVEGAYLARYSSSGHLLFMREQVLFAVPFDASSLRVTGDAVAVVEDVSSSLTDGVASYAVSTNGTLVYLKASEWNVPRRLLWADRAGRETPFPIEDGQWAEPRLSPDGKWVAFTRLDPQWRVMLFDMQRRITTQLTRNVGVAFSPNWSPDSRSVIHAVETPVYDVHRTPIDGSMADTLRVSKRDKMPSSVSQDGLKIAYHETYGTDALMIAPIGAGVATPFDPRPGYFLNADFSPDGKWIVYNGAAVGERSEVWVRALDGHGGRRQVSSAGGDQPLWTRGGREIIYRKGASVLAVSFDPSTGDVGVPATLFSKPDAGRLGGTRTRGYDVSADGSRFLLVTPVERPGVTPMVVVINWFGELRRRVPP